MLEVSYFTNAIEKTCD